MSTSSKIKTLPELLETVAGWRKQNLSIVFTNGCFDLLHLGHVDYLEKASQLADRMVIGLNTDQSVSRLKGPSRPLQDEYSRARIMAALDFVDAVTLFDEPTPLKLIEAVSPDILTKGDDYTIDNIVGADFVLGKGGRVVTVPLVQGYSTTNIVRKIESSL